MNDSLLTGSYLRISCILKIVWGQHHNHALVSHATPPNVPHWYYMCDTYVCGIFAVLHMWFIHISYMCRTHVIYTFHTCKRLSKMSTFSHVCMYTFSDPLPKVYRPTFVGFWNKGFIQHNIYCTTTQINHLPSLFDICDKWYLWLCIMIYKLQLILYSFKFHLKKFVLSAQWNCSISQYKI